MSEPGAARGLSQAELAEVLRRAAELDSQGALPVPVDRYDPTDIEDAAAEVGLSRDAVRRAIHEVLHPDDAAPDPYADGPFPSRELVLERQVPGRADEVEARVGRYLRRQLFEQQRVFADGSRWAPRKGMFVGVRRNLDPGGRLALNQVRCVQITVSPAAGDDEPATVVRVRLDLTDVRAIHAVWLGAGGAIGLGAIAGTTALVGIDPLLLASIPVAGGATVGGHLVGRWQSRSEVEKIHTAVAGMLDRLEHGERALGGGGRARPGSGRPPRPSRRDRSTPPEHEKGDR